MNSKMRELWLQQIETGERSHSGMAEVRQVFNSVAKKIVSDVYFS
jgi:hypothetical protein